MRRELMRATAIVTTTLAAMAIAPRLFAQESQPTLPSNFLGPQLIAWSQQQRPQPMAPRPDSLDQHKETEPTQPVQQQPEVQTFTGDILKDRGNNKYVLKVSSDDVYQIDEPDKVSTYEGKHVMLVGILDTGRRSIRVSIIRLHS
jgi:hypothetical protein